MSMPRLVEAGAKTAAELARRGLSRLRGTWWDTSRPECIAPVFVVGCSRAGTTLVYKTLSLARELGSLNRETHDFWDALHPLADRGWSSHCLGADDASKRDREFVARHFYSQTGRRRFVDKNNQNGLAVPYLHALFPDARFVFIKRNPGDNILSLMRGWERPEEYGTWSGDLPAEVRVDGGRLTRWCFFLPPGWRAHLGDTLADICAWQYAQINQAMLAARRSLPGTHWHEVSYEGVLADPVGEFRRMFAHCGLTFSPAVERHCGEVLSRPYNAFSPVGTDKWRASSRAAEIERSMESLGLTARALGYGTG